MDTLSTMFRWWNAAFCNPKGFTPESFAHYWTDDAELIINGRPAVKGLEALAAHFVGIQSRVEQVEIILPFEMVHQTDNRIFTWHYVRVLNNNKRSVEQVMGYADLIDDRIQAVNFTGVDLAENCIPSHLK